VLLDLECLPVDHPLLALRLQWLTAEFTARTDVGSIVRWLDSGLVARLLRILRALPSECHPPHAAVVCAAAAAVVTNLAAAHASLRVRQSLPRAAELLATDGAAVTALLQCGVLHPSAAQQLPPDCAMHLERLYLLAPNPT
jgi:hypothetical protein